MSETFETELKDIKSLVEKIGPAFEEYKRTNDDRIKAMEEGGPTAELEAKLKKIDEDLDKWIDSKDAIEQFMKEHKAPVVDTPEAQDFSKELKAFNLMLKSDALGKNRPVPGEMDAKAYTDYKSGFFKVAVGIKSEDLPEAERKALSAGSDPDGGYLLPHSTVGKVIAKVYEQSIMRQIAMVQTISTAKIEGVIDNDEADAGWVMEMGSRNDTDTPQVGRYEIEAFEMYAQPKATQTLLDDAAVDIENWLAMKVASKFSRVEGSAFWTGNGAGKPRGLADYTTVVTDDDSRAWGQLQHVISGANGGFDATLDFDPIHDLIGAFRSQYLNNASFCMRRSVRTAARKLKDGDARYIWEPSLQAAQPERLLGYAARIDEYMPALATGSLSLAFGDFAEAYCIVDRMGIRTLRDPYTDKPFVKFYSTRRVGGGCVNFEAVKFLKFSA